MACTSCLLHGTRLLLAAVISNTFEGKVNIVSNDFSRQRGKVRLVCQNFVSAPKCMSLYQRVDVASSRGAPRFHRQLQCLDCFCLGASPQACHVRAYWVSVASGEHHDRCFRPFQCHEELVWQWVPLDFEPSALFWGIGGSMENKFIGSR